MPTIYDAIKTDHDEHRAMLSRIHETSGNSAERRSAWSQFYRDVKSHAAAEEETFYSKLISKTWGQEHARHSIHEHQSIDDLLEELNELDMASPGWLQKFKKLRHEYEHHIEEEETEIFPRAREVIADREIEGFGARFVERKKEESKLIEQKREDSLEE